MLTLQVMSNLEIFVLLIHRTVELGPRLMVHALHLLDLDLVPRVPVPDHRLLVLLATVLLCVNKVGLLTVQQTKQTKEEEVILDFLHLMHIWLIVRIQIWNAFNFPLIIPRAKHLLVNNPSQQFSEGL